jgi:hypothetical protein
VSLVMGVEVSNACLLGQSKSVRADANVPKAGPRHTPEGGPDSADRDCWPVMEWQRRECGASKSVAELKSAIAGLGEAQPR